MTGETRRRREILAVLDESGVAASAQDLFARLVDSGSRIGRTTVFRALTEFAGRGILDVVLSPSGERLYRRAGCDGPPLVCTRCGSCLALDLDAVDEWAHEIARTHGFTSPRVRAAFFGACAVCAARDARSVGS